MRKDRIENILARAAYWSGLDRLCYRLTRNRKRVLMYHNVLPNYLFRDDLANGFSCSESKFRDDIRWIVRHLGGISNDMSDASKVAITFDDGICNQYEVAARVLREEGNYPAMIFCAGKALAAKRPEETLAVERVLCWLSNAPEDALAKIGVADRSAGWQRVLWPKFQDDVQTKGERVCAELDGIFPFKKIYSALPAEYLRLRMTGIGAKQLDDLRDRGWIVGWHTQSHFPLKLLSEEEQIQELTPPLKMKCLPFAYPYGDGGCVSLRTREIAKKLGYAVAFASCPQPNNDPFFFSRYILSANRVEFWYHFSGARYFIRRVLKVLRLITVV